LGYTSDTVVLLPLVPLVQIAWANREVSSRELERIRELLTCAALTREVLRSTCLKAG
jgi:hypothetical protein